MSRSIEAWLPDFSETDPGSAAGAGAERVPPFIAPLEELDTPQIDIGKIVADAVREARQEEVQKAQGQMAEALEQERIGFAKKLEEERAKWILQESEVFARRLSQTLSELETYLSDTVARIVTPFIKQVQREKAVVLLAESVRELLASEEQQKLVISGPEDLLQNMRDRLEQTYGPLPVSVQFVQQDSPDIRVVMGQTILETQIAAWSDRLDTALA